MEVFEDSTSQRHLLSNRRNFKERIQFPLDGATQYIVIVHHLGTNVADVLSLVNEVFDRLCLCSWKTSFGRNLE